MSWQALARKDFEDVVRSRLIWAALGLFVMLILIIALGYSQTQSGDPTTADFINLFAQLGAWLVIPLIAIMIGYMAIVGERQSGSLRVLFGLSFSRGDVIAGKLASRNAVIVLVSVVALILGPILAILTAGSLDVGMYVLFALFTILLAIVFTTVAVSVSASTSTRYRAMGGAVGAYILFAFLWHPIVAGIHYLVKGSLAELHAPEWYFFLNRLNPLEAYNQVISALIDQYVWGMIGWVNIVEDVEATSMEAPNLLLSNRVEGELPFYLSDWFAVIILLAWVLVPAVIGYWRFVRADLN